MVPGAWFGTGSGRCPDQLGGTGGGVPGRALLGDAALCSLSSLEELWPCFPGKSANEESSVCVRRADAVLATLAGTRPQGHPQPPGEGQAMTVSWALSRESPGGLPCLPPPCLRPAPLVGSKPMQDSEGLMSQPVGCGWSVSRGSLITSYAQVRKSKTESELSEVIT